MFAIWKAATDTILIKLMRRFTWNLAIILFQRVEDFVIARSVSAQKTRLSSKLCRFSFTRWPLSHLSKRCMTSSIQKLFRIIFILHDLSTFTDLIFQSQLINNYSRDGRATLIFSTRTRKGHRPSFLRPFIANPVTFSIILLAVNLLIIFYTFDSPLTANRSSVTATNGITVDFLHGIPWRNKGNQISTARVGQPELEG